MLKTKEIVSSKKLISKIFSFMIRWGINMYRKFIELKFLIV